MVRPKLTEPHACICGYSTFRSDHMKNHRKTCKQEIAKDAKIAFLEQKLIDQKEQLTEQLKTKDEQLKTKDEQLRAKDEQILNLTNLIFSGLKSRGRE